MARGKQGGGKKQGVADNSTEQTEVGPALHSHGTKVMAQVDDVVAEMGEELWKEMSALGFDAEGTEVR